MPHEKYIESYDISIDTLFSDFYVVPSYQREYIWETDNVEEFFTDIYNSFSLSKDESLKYFIGNIVVCPGQNNLFEIIDGQQRITTSYLFLCNFRDFLKEHGEEIKSLDNQIADSYLNDEGTDEFLYRLTLQYTDSQDVLLKLAKGEFSIDEHDNGTRSVNNIVNAYKYIRVFLNENFSDNIDEARRFYAYFNKHVLLVKIFTSNVKDALKVFETINSKGVGLDAMDLLKNLIFINTPHDLFDKLNTKWKNLTDSLYSAKEKPLRFLRYFIFSNFTVKELIREDDIYDWFVSNASSTGISSAPLKFVDTLQEFANAYINFIKGQGKSGESNRYLKNIKFLSGTARQHVILLLAGKHLSKDDFLKLCEEIENLFFCFIVSRTVTRELERKFIDWAPKIKKVKNSKQLEKFIKDEIQPEKDSLSSRVHLALTELSEDNLQQYRIKYILAKMSQFINENALGEDTWSDLGNFINRYNTIEHILPQTPTQEIIDSFEKPKDKELESYIPMLGNLCLLEKTINSSVHNKPYDEKIIEYPNSSFLLVQSMVKKLKMGNNTAYNRAVEKLKPFKTWNATEIEERQELLLKLAFEIWNIPLDSE